MGVLQSKTTGILVALSLAFGLGQSGALAQNHAGLLEELWVESAPGTASPTVEVTLEDGSTLALADLAGQAVVVNFWATWCGPCRAEMPTFAALQDMTFDGEAQPIVLAVALERNYLAAQRFLGELGASNLTLGLDASGESFRNLPEGGIEELRGLPATFVVNADGTLKGYLPGPADWASERAVEIVAQAVATSAEG